MKKSDKIIIISLAIFLLVSLTLLGIFLLSKPAESSKSLNEIRAEIYQTQRESNICFNEIDDYFSIKRYDLVYLNIDACRLKINQGIALVDRLFPYVQKEDDRLNLLAAKEYLKLISGKMEIVKVASNIASFSSENSERDLNSLSNNIEELDRLIEKNRLTLNELNEKYPKSDLIISSFSYDAELASLDEISMISQKLKSNLAKLQ